jgi:hypothetical protein
MGWHWPIACDGLGPPSLGAVAVGSISDGSCGGLAWRGGRLPGLAPGRVFGALALRPLTDRARSRDWMVNRTCRRTLSITGRPPSVTTRSSSVSFSISIVSSSSFSCAWQSRGRGSTLVCLYSTEAMQLMDELALSGRSPRRTGSGRGTASPDLLIREPPVISLSTMCSRLLLQPTGPVRHS